MSGYLLEGMTMHRYSALAVGLVVMLAVNAAHAQDPTVADSIGQNGVRNLSISGGKLVLSSAAHPGPASMPNGAYESDAKTVIVFLDGRITRVEYATGTISQVASMRLQNGRVMLMPPVTALMQISAFPLPSGTFTMRNGSAFLKVVSGRPAEFSLQ